MSARVAVLDHGMGNLRSVSKALEAAGATTVVTDDAGEARAGVGLCVPGQGIFGRCMTNIRRDGAEDLIRSWIDDGRPFLGICLGMQILFEHSEEGNARGLGILPGRVRRLAGDVRVPHIGWNTVSRSGGDVEYYYFDHSFAVDPEDESIVHGWSDHGRRFAAWVTSGSVTAVQFHPEKSSRAGIELLGGWVKGL